jgi:hypothetical protein
MGAGIKQGGRLHGKGVARLGQSGEGRKQFFFEKKAAPALREPKNF